jgi:corrinoid protein of di/trimethylamine methyltransferase
MSSGPTLVGDEAPKTAEDYLQSMLSAQKEKFEENPILKELAMIIIDGKIDESVASTQRALDEGLPPLLIINEGLSAGMRVVGDYFGNRIYFLPEVLLSATAMQNALKVVLPIIEAASKEKRGTVVIGTVEGDIHDIGKGIVKALLTAEGYSVHDLGRDVPVQDFVAKAKELDADVIAMSTLMTPTLESMRRVEELLKKEGLKGRFQTIVGGGSVTPEFAQSIGSDAYGKDAGKAVKEVKGLFERRNAKQGPP